MSKFKIGDLAIRDFGSNGADFVVRITNMQTNVHGNWFYHGKVITSDSDDFPPGCDYNLGYGVMFR